MWQNRSLDWREQTCGFQQGGRAGDAGAERVGSVNFWDRLKVSLGTAAGDGKYLVITTQIRK